jgi:hypothetical protein
MEINDVLSRAEKELPLCWNNAVEGAVVHKLFSSYTKQLEEQHETRRKGAKKELPPDKKRGERERASS